MNEADLVRRVITAGLQETEQYFGRAKLLILAIGLFVVVGGGASEGPWFAAIGSVVLAGLIGLMVFVQRRVRNHPIRKILRDEPQRVTKIEYYATSSASGAFPSHFLSFHVGDQQLPVRFDENVLVTLAPLLPRYFVDATIAIPGFDPGSAGGADASASR